jgi:hypothetical protein
MDIRNELIQIKQSIQDLHTELSQTKSELRKLRLVIQDKRREKPKEATLTNPMWCYEWDQMTIDLDPKTWKSIKNGDLVVARGRGTRLEAPLPNGDDRFQRDVWTFNKEWKGSVIIEMGEPEELPEMPDIAYRGDIEYLDIEETEVQVTRKKVTKPL